MSMLVPGGPPPRTARPKAQTSCRCRSAVFGRYVDCQDSTASGSVIAEWCRGRVASLVLCGVITRDEDNRERLFIGAVTEIEELARHYGSTQVTQQKSL